MKIPTIEEKETTWKVIYPDERDIEYGSLVGAVEAAYQFSNVIRFKLREKVAKAPYTGSIENE